MVKCKVVKVSVFGYKGKDYFPGDIVEVPKHYAELDFLQPIKEEPVAEKKAAKPEKPGK